MTDINDLQEAMRTWRMAFNAMSDYFEENDILDPVCLERWTELEAAQDKAQAEVKRLVQFCRSSC